jgi:hypothetical protein
LACAATSRLYLLNWEKLRRRSDVDTQAEILLAELLATPVSQEEFSETIAALQGLEEPVRRRLSAVRPGWESDWMLAEVRERVLPSGGSPAWYARALEWMMHVQEFVSSAEVTSLLGMAQYRAGRFADAAQTLSSIENPDPWDAAFLALALSRVGQPEKAMPIMEALRSYMKDPQAGSNRFLQQIVQEAESVLSEQAADSGAGEGEGVAAAALDWLSQAKTSY